MEAPQIAMFTTPSMGHLIPLIELARNLLHRHNFNITIIIPDDGSPIHPQQQLLQTLPAINYRFLPRTTLDDLPHDAGAVTRITLSVTRSIPLLCEVLTELKESTRLTALVVDIFASLALEAVKDLGIPSYIFYPSPAMVLSLAFHLPYLDQSCSCEYRDLPQPLNIPGCKPFHASKLPHILQDRKSRDYEFILEVCRKVTVAEGVLVNSFVELESDAFKAFEKNSRIHVYPVGPLIRAGSDLEKAECLEWLNKQPEGSVLYVCFGSAWTLSEQQWKELALGLEMSGQRFLVVVRDPNQCMWNRERGFVELKWAPQVEVLRHGAVGGFVTHCGWNSTLESIVHGVPLIAWPLYAEQKMNAMFLSEDMKVAMMVKENDKGLVEAEQVSKLVKSLMEGEEGVELRSRMRNLKDIAGRALADDGSSTMALANLAQKWISN